MGLKPRERPADVEAKYHVALNYPNLELHSAAASGNVGLVHYALTHGQPVNSVLHGVLPLHAACSGGSVSVVRMLIERGADVNAPRLPRRYSDGKKSTAPSVGAAGSTPLHFAAANGHADIVQILLTCGAKANKADKNGMTPEALAEINGHTDVIRVLRVWEHLMAGDARDTVSIAPSMSHTINGQDPSPPESAIDDSASVTGKNRSASFASQRSTSTTGSVIRLKHSLESIGFRKGGRASRSGSMASSTRGDIPRLTPLAVDGNDNQPPSPNDYSPSTSSPHHPDFEGLDRTFSHSSANSLLVPPDQQSVHDMDFSPASGLGPTPSRNNPSITGSSRRPSLPSILEKPGAAFRAALRRDNHRPPPLDTSAIASSPPSESALSSLSPQVSPTNPTTHSRGGFFRGRQSSGDEQTKQRHARKYMSKHALTHLFKRGQSPPSRSPSPPDRSTPTQPIDPEQLQEGIERLKRASLDMDREQSVYGSAEDLTEMRPPLPPQPQSAPATKTSFFHEELDPSAATEQFSSTPLPTSSTLPQLSSTRDLPNSAIQRRPRKTSEVIAPSPLAQEWANSSDSDTPPTIGIRRAKTEVIKSPQSDFAAMAAAANFPRPALQAHRTQPPSPLRPPISRSHNASSSSSSSLASPARSVSGARIAGAGRADSSELRRAASIKRVSRQYEENPRTSLDSERSGAESVEDTETEDAEPKASIDLTESENEVFHDADDADDAHDADADEDENEEEAASRLSEEEEEEAVKTTPNASELSYPTLPPSVGLGVPVGPEAGEQVSTRSSEVGNGSRTPVEHELSVPRNGRYRGASIGSATTTESSSRISTTPSLRMSQITTDDEPRTPTSGQFEGSFFPMSINLAQPGTRARGKSISSISSNPSDLAFSYNMPSSPATSLTPPSTVSVNLGRFPPVPEHDVAPAPQRRVSNRAEAREMKKQAEEGIMQLAQLPDTLDSSRDLAAQLAAYGDGHALERQFAERERRLAGGTAGGETTGESESDAARSEDDYFSAMSDAASRLSTNDSEFSHQGAGPSRRRVTPPSNLRNAVLPSAKSGKAQKSIDSIYAKREAAYRERMAALTALPPTFPSSFSSSYRANGSIASSGHSGHARIASGGSWLTAGSHNSQHQPPHQNQHEHHQQHHQHHRPHHPAQRVPSQHHRASDAVEPEPEIDHHPDISGPLPVHSAEGVQAARQVSGGGKRAAAAQSIRHAASKASSLGHGSQPGPSAPAMSTRTVSASSRSGRQQQAAAPIADVVKTRYAGMSPPSNVPQPPRLESSSPYISVFSHRYAGQPHDGDDSDDESHPDQRLTVVENNWGGRAVGGGDDFKKGRWGQLKGAIGHLGHRK